MATQTLDTVNAAYKSKKTVAAKCPTTGTVGPMGCHLNGTAKCCDSNIRTYHSTSRQNQGQPVSFTKWTAYDPRLRPWYKTAVDKWQRSGSQVAWTPIYKFSTTGKLGVTASGVFVANNTIKGVVAVDYDLSTISAVLKRSLTGRSSWAYLVERTGPFAGFLVAATSIPMQKERMLANHSFGAQFPTIVLSAEMLQTVGYAPLLRFHPYNPATCPMPTVPYTTLSCRADTQNRPNILTKARYHEFCGFVHALA